MDRKKKYYDYIKNNRPELWGGFERSEAPINDMMLLVLDAIEKKYSPQSQPPNTNENNKPIINQAVLDSLTKHDTTKKDSNKKP